MTCGWRTRALAHVEESLDDLVPALAQMCIKALASDVRDDDSTQQVQQMPIDGVLMNGDRAVGGNAGRQQLTLRDALNKVIHGTPVSIEVRDDEVWLHFGNSSVRETWTEVWFSGTQLLRQLEMAYFTNIETKELKSESGRLGGSLPSSVLNVFFPRRCQASE